MPTLGLTVADDPSCCSVSFGLPDTAVGILFALVVFFILLWVIARGLQSTGDTLGAIAYVNLRLFLFLFFAVVVAGLLAVT